MNNLDTTKWTIFKIEDIFYIYTGQDLILRDVNVGDIPVASHTGKNNGVGEYVDNISNRKLFNSNKTISLADRGLFQATVQFEDFYIGTRVKALELKNEFSNKNILKFIATIINVENFRFNYGRNSTDKLPKLEIKLPSKLNKKNEYEPDWEYMENYIKNIEHKKIEEISKFNNIFDIKDDKKIDTELWKEFNVKDIFMYKTCPNVIIRDIDDGEIPLVSRTAYNNGISGFVSAEKDKITKGNCITIGGEGLYAFYQESDFATGVKVYKLENKNLNKYNALFICSILNLEVYKYAYGRARVLEKIKNEVIKLPAKLNNKNQYEPDWEYMENYIKNTIYGKYL